MLFEWSAECSEDDPTLDVPWQDPSGRCRFVDLRADPYAIEEIPEAEAHPALQQALRALNAARSPLLTAKCDVWEASPEELISLCATLLMEGSDCAAGFLSYVDVLCRDRALFTSFHQQQHLLGRFERRLAALDQPFALAEAVVRPALLDLTAPIEGYSVTLYVKATGADRQQAYERWAEALEAVTRVLRSRDLLPQT